MPMGFINLRPGVNRERTASLNEAGISESQLIRFKDGLAQKLGGWTRLYAFNVSGTPKWLHAWQDFNGADRLAVGTTTALLVIEDGDETEITPQTLTTNFAPVFDTTSGSTTVTITDSNVSGVTIYDSVYFNTPISVGGIILSGLHRIAAIVSTDTYQIEVATQATANVTNGGAVPVFTTTNNDATVDVTLEDHGLAEGDIINFPISTAFNGVTILGNYVVTNVIDADNFSIASNVTATATGSTSMNGAQCQLVYYISLGPPEDATGYGGGAYGSGGYGTGSSSSAQVGNPITSTDWTFDNWGDTLISCTAGGGIYVWQPTGGFLNADLISTGPPFSDGIFIAMPAQILVAWGSTSEKNIGVSIDPLLIRWSDQLDYAVFVDSTTNQAGSFRIPTGSRIVGGMQGPQFALIWTDLDVWAMQYIGFPLVFGFNKIGSNAGLIARHAATQLGSQVYWMGRSNFFVLAGGGAAPIPCPVWDEVFQDLDTANQSKCWAWANTPFNEVWWFYPSLSGGSGACDSYVKYNVVEGEWDHGSLGRVCGIDQSVFGEPISIDNSGAIYQHETSNNADGVPMSSSFTTGYWSLTEGQDIAFVDWILPDMRWGKIGAAQTASVNLTFNAVMYPGDTPVTFGPYTVTQSTQYVNTRIRARQISVTVASSDLDSFWRLGRIRYRVAPDGRY